MSAFLLALLLQAEHTASRREFCSAFYHNYYK